MTEEKPGSLANENYKQKMKSWQDNFYSDGTTMDNPNKYNERMFSNYAFVKEIDSEKTANEILEYFQVNDTVFEKDFGLGKRKYYMQLIHISDDGSIDDSQIDSHNKYFAVSFPKLNDNEIKQLLPYCPCLNCRPPRRFFYVKYLITIIGLALGLSLFNQPKNFPANILGSCILVLYVLIGAKFFYIVPKELMYCSCCYGCISSMFSSSNVELALRRKFESDKNPSIKKNNSCNNLTCAIIRAVVLIIFNYILSIINV